MRLEHGQDDDRANDENDKDSDEAAEAASCVLQDAKKQITVQRPPQAATSGANEKCNYFVDLRSQK